MSIVLTIPEATPSLNLLMRLHWTRKLRLKQRWDWLVKESRIVNRATPEHQPYAAVTIERWGPKPLDHDNLVGGCKPLLDALVKEGFLVDDSPDHVRVKYLQSVGEPHTTIIIDSQLS